MRVQLAVSFDFACRLAAGVILGAPVAAIVTASGVGAFPEGDRLLFAPGGALLLELLRASFSLLPALATSSLATGVVLSAGLVVPQAVLVTALAERSREPVRAFLGRAGARVPGLLGLSGLAFLAQALVVALALGFAAFIREKLLANALRADAAAMTVLGLGGLLWLGLGLLRDLASAALACGELGTRDALRQGLACLRRAPGPAFGRWLGPHVLAVGLVSAVALATGALDVSKPEGVRLLAVALLHQGVVLGLCVCRAIWLSGAIRVVETTLVKTPARDPAAAERADASASART
jgi:hypothetical protein